MLYADWVCVSTANEMFFLSLYRIFYRLKTRIISPGKSELVALL